MDLDQAALSAAAAESKQTAPAQATEVARAEPVAGAEAATDQAAPAPQPGSGHSAPPHQQDDPPDNPAAFTEALEQNAAPRETVLPNMHGFQS